VTELSQKQISQLRTESRSPDFRERVSVSHRPAEPSSILGELDKPRTFKEAAGHLGVPYHVVQRAARRGLVPTYRLGTSRPYVKLRDFLDLMSRNHS
jgi:hypothetical protein